MVGFLDNEDFPIALSAVVASVPFSVRYCYFSTRSYVTSDRSARVIQFELQRILERHGGRIDVDTFTQTVTELTEREDPRLWTRQAFKAMDTQQRGRVHPDDCVFRRVPCCYHPRSLAGYLQVEDLTDVIANMRGPRIAEHVVRQMFLEADSNEDGKVRVVGAAYWVANHAC